MGRALLHSLIRVSARSVIYSTGRYPILLYRFSSIVFSHMIIMVVYTIIDVFCLPQVPVLRPPCPVL